MIGRWLRSLPQGAIGVLSLRSLGLALRAKTWELVTHNWKYKRMISSAGFDGTHSGPTVPRPATSSVPHTLRIRHEVRE